MSLTSGRRFALTNVRILVSMLNSTFGSGRRDEFWPTLKEWLLEKFEGCLSPKEQAETYPLAELLFSYPIFDKNGARPPSSGEFAS